MEAQLTNTLSPDSVLSLVQKRYSKNACEVPPKGGATLEHFEGASCLLTVQLAL